MTKEVQRKNVLSRLRKIEGQVKGIQRMIEEDADCAEILNQVSAVKAAVNQVGVLIFKKYARECILESNEPADFEKALEDTFTMMNRIYR
ncbi:MAG: metal-sensitive transcriptional regulator [Solirubrobacterales bacterium]